VHRPTEGTAECGGDISRGGDEGVDSPVGAERAEKVLVVVISKSERRALHLVILSA